MAESVDIQRMIEKAYDDAVQKSTPATRGAESLAFPIPDPRLLCPIYKTHKDEVCRWLKERLGEKIGGLICGLLSIVCA